jgi:hypothetical protein
MAHVSDYLSPMVIEHLVVDQFIPNALMTPLDNFLDRQWDTTVQAQVTRQHFHGVA